MIFLPFRTPNIPTRYIPRLPCNKAAPPDSDGVTIPPDGLRPLLGLFRAVPLCSDELPGSSELGLGWLNYRVYR